MLQPCCNKDSGDCSVHFGSERRLLFNFVAFRYGDSIFVAIRALVTVIDGFVIIKIAAVKPVAFDDQYQLFYLAREESWQLLDLYRNVYVAYGILIRSA